MAKMSCTGRGTTLTQNCRVSPPGWRRLIRLLVVAWCAGACTSFMGQRVAGKQVLACGVAPRFLRRGFLVLRGAPRRVLGRSFGAPPKPFCSGGLRLGGGA